ncbi:hypothetical protein LTR10_020883 [Elasticomyces elasticus]|uniref:FAD/NAD(P)-binding domain-containing protein n=1 Tax=Exophiala sideris TaxID=1016849 RepID=A0ABR0IZN8_9EURO|nr:hypothetical protein LTR10_020883 [Elasticomyces elasticus]KAK5023404.1 hypothetical protein LTS07_009279 [Exophiala sideris]KAK5028220.1 hypothetical protein LTR13_009208 [Exophiala sideris]KAK5052878.1 hypothetical protein LTR69_009704 [Exophiala sideris]KAK5178489.1 hypothetical protein LTR44_009114 [Eurotiomycetes sp. CCFEE 6388]
MGSIQKKQVGEEPLGREQLGTKTDVILDAEAIEVRNLSERNKRLVKGGIAQFREATGDLAKFALDHWSVADGHRTPVDEDVDVLVVGCGFGGILAATRLHEAEITDIRMVDKASDFGGVWYWNRYPGLYCDTESYIYLPLLEETDYVPSAKYVPGYEIQAQALRIAEKEKLRDHAFFQTEVNSITWDDKSSRWTCKTNRGDVCRARFVISAIGILHKLHLPGITGIEHFKGHSFHTSRWDYKYTGGDRYGGVLEKLKGKRVGLIGTGASTIQVLPHLALSGAETYIFQRTPSAVDERVNPQTDETWFKSLPSGWQDERADNFDKIFYGGEESVDMVDDGWTRHIYALHKQKDNLPYAERLKHADNIQMELIRQRTKNIVKKSETAEALQAWYGRACKRPCFHGAYLEAFNCPNVHLVDTNGKGVSTITRKGVVVGDRNFDLDCIIYATGFDWGNDYSARANMEITGRNGLTMSEKWVAGPSTFQGMIGHDFPNLLLFTHLQSSTSPNYTHLLSERAKHAAYIVSETIKRGANSVEPTQKAEDAWVEKLENIAAQYLDFFKLCTPGYLNQEGQLSKFNLRNASIGLSAPQWNDMAAAWRKQGDMEGLELDGQAAVQQKAT